MADEPMALDRVKAAISLHGVTASKQAHVHGQRQDWAAVGRHNAIAAAAAAGILLAPTADEPSIPELVEAAAHFGLLAPLEDVPIMDKEACIAAIRQHGKTADLIAGRGNLDQGAHQRLHDIADAAAGGRLLAARPGDASTPHLHEAAQFHGLIEPDDSLSE